MLEQPCLLWIWVLSGKITFVAFTKVTDMPINNPMSLNIVPELRVGESKSCVLFPVKAVMKVMANILTDYSDR